MMAVMRASFRGTKQSVGVLLPQCIEAEKAG
jgi:hypothetical protein